MSTIFSKIISGEIDSDIVYQDDLVTAFRDISPIAPTHILIVPNKEIATVNDIEAADQAMVGQMLVVAGKIAAEQGIAASGYRLVINCGRDAHQEVMHIHMHLVGGSDLGPMLDRDIIRRNRRPQV